MAFLELFLLAVGLSMDAFAVSICKGLSLKKTGIKESLTVGLWFGSFQAGMPLLGYLGGKYLADYITSFDHWIAFILLAAIGGNMIRESLKKECDECCEAEASINHKEMLVLAIATSIDALAVGITFAFLRVNIVIAVITIGVITFILSAFGVRVGNVFGMRFKSKAEFAGGAILMILGLKILLEHLGIL